ncbi:MAG: hypothetical protein WCT44_03755 [Candidatus Paceibacterota bacterium]
MKAQNLDRVFGVIFAILVLAIGVLGEMTQLIPNAKWTTGVLLVLVATGIRYNGTGWWAQFKWMGDRKQYFVDEGIFLVFWFLGFSADKFDCRKKVTPLKPTEATTADGARVLIDEIVITHQVEDLGAYTDVDPTNRQNLLDNVVDKFVRKLIRANDLDVVMGMAFGENVAGSQLWGVTIHEMIVPQVRIADPKLREVYELKKVELLEKEAQFTGGENFAKLMALLEKPIAEGGAGLEHDDAVKEAKLLTNQATETIQTINVDGDAGTAIVASLLGRNK